MRHRIASTSLTGQVIKLAYNNPGPVRDALLPILKKTAIQIPNEGKDNSDGLGYYPLPSILHQLGLRSEAFKFPIEHKVWPLAGIHMLTLRVNPKLSISKVNIKALLKRFDLSRIQSHDIGKISFYFQSPKFIVEPTESAEPAEPAEPKFKSKQASGNINSIEGWTPSGGTTGMSDYHWADPKNEIAFSITADGGLSLIYDGLHWDWPKRFDRDRRPEMLELVPVIASKTHRALLQGNKGTLGQWKRGQVVNDWYMQDIMRVAGQFDKELAVFNRQWPFYSELKLVFEKRNTGRQAYIGTAFDQVPPRKAAQMVQAKLADRISGTHGDYLELTTKGIRLYQDAEDAFSEI